MDFLKKFIKYLEDVLCEIMNANKILRNEDEYIPGRKYDLIVTQLWKYEATNENILNQIKEALDENGLACILVPVAMLFAMKNQRFREELNVNFHIKGVITLKNSVFEKTSIPMAILLLNFKKAETWLTSAANMEELITLLKDEKKYMKKVYYSSNLKINNLMPEYYNEESEKLEETMKQYNTKTLGEIADIIVGKSVSREELSDHDGVPYLRARNIINEKIVTSDTYVEQGCLGKYSKQILMLGDIVISKNFGERRLAQITEDDLPAVASNGLIIIRAVEVPDEYLYRYFTSKTGKAIFMNQISLIEKGTTIVSINIHDLKELRIPIFDRKTMLELSNIEKLDKEETHELVQKLDKRVFESHVEKMVINQFCGVGWNNSDIIFNNRRYVIQMGSDRKWYPDIVLLDNEEMIAIVEVKGSMRLVTNKWSEQMKAIIKQSVVKLLIITTSAFYDAYITGTEKYVRFSSAPTKTQLLDLLESEVHE